MAKLFLGCDIGSTTTKCVILGNDFRITGKAVVEAGAGTAAPSRAINMALIDAGAEPGDIGGICATGYGRNLLEEAGQMGLNRLVYTGFTYEELVEHENRLVAKCLSLIDMLIDGPYKKEQPPDKPWAGSGNQRILELRGGVIQREYEKKDIQVAEDIAGELIISRTGTITATGIIDGKIFD